MKLIVLSQILIYVARLDCAIQIRINAGEPRDILFARSLSGKKDQPRFKSLTQEIKLRHIRIAQHWYDDTTIALKIKCPFRGQAPDGFTHRRHTGIEPFHKPLDCYGLSRRNFPKKDQISEFAVHHFVYRYVGLKGHWFFYRRLLLLIC